jgi:SAM-dependent methyltransferase
VNADAARNARLPVVPRHRQPPHRQPPHRDLARFEQRAPHYEKGVLGRLHQEITDRSAALALAENPTPQRVLDVGCGTGYLLRLLASRCPGAVELAGIDPSPAMVEVARNARGGGNADGRVHFSVGYAERLPYPDASFDLVVSTTSFDHWSAQQAGLAECARITNPGGRLVLVDQFSIFVAPTLVMGRRGKARTKGRATRLLSAAGFHSLAWHDVYAVIIKAVTAVR